MSWSRRRLLAGLAALPGCGFAPVYGPGGAAEGLSGEIVVDAPTDEAGYDFVRYLETRLGRAGSGRYRLSPEITVIDEGLGVTPEGEITLIRLLGRLRYTLTDTRRNRRVASGTLSSFTSYPAPVIESNRTTIAGNQVTVRSARDDAIKRLMVILADQLVAELLATADDWRA